MGDNQAETYSMVCMGVPSSETSITPVDMGDNPAAR